MPNWSVKYDHLDKDQINFLNKCLNDGKSHWICGFPGSGKSTILSHAIKSIKADNPSASVAVVVYTQSLVEMYKAAFREIGAEGATLKTMYHILNDGNHYDYILCDEVQDMTRRIIDAMKAKCNHLIVAGDENQSIYRQDVRFHEATLTPEEIKSYVGGDKYELTVVHRLSPAVQEAVQKFMPELAKLHDVRNPADKSYKIRLCHSRERDNEVKYIWKEAVKAPNIGKTSAVLFPSKPRVLDFVDMVCDLEKVARWQRQLNQYNGVDFVALNSYLSSNNIRLQYVGSGCGSFSNENCVFLMTYQSSKGLDFDNVFLPDIDERLYIAPDPEIAKATFMVAMTRCRNELYVCYSGTPHIYVSYFAGSCSNVNVDDYLNPAKGAGGNFGF